MLLRREEAQSSWWNMQTSGVFETSEHSMHFMVVQGIANGDAAEPDSQQGSMDAYAQNSNNQGSTAHPPSAQHPLASLLSDFHYAPWQLEAMSPQAPKVGMTHVLVMVSMTQHQSSLG